MEKNMIQVEWINEEKGQEGDVGQSGNTYGETLEQSGQVCEITQRNADMTGMTEFGQVREGDRTYLTCVWEADCADEEAMLTDNRPDGYLRVLKKCMNGKISIFYDITGKQSLPGCYRKKPVGKEELTALLLSVKRCLDQAEEYLLSEDRLVLCPAHIYTNLTGKQFYFVYFPSQEGTLGEHVRELAYFLMEHVDYQEDFAPALAGQFVHYAEAENFSMSIFLEENREYFENTALEKKQEECAEDADAPAESRSGTEEGGYFQEPEEGFTKRIRLVRQIGAAIAGAALLAAISLPQSAKYLILFGACAGAAAGMLPRYAGWAERRLTQKEREVFMLSEDET